MSEDHERPHHNQAGAPGEEQLSEDRRIENMTFASQGVAGERATILRLLYARQTSR